MQCTVGVLYMPMSCVCVSARIRCGCHLSTCHSLSDASVAFVKAMVNPSADNAQRIELLKRAAEQHQVWVPCARRCLANSNDRILVLCRRIHASR